MALQRERYRRKGWSAAKIERALLTRSLAHQRKSERPNKYAWFRERVVAWSSAYGQVGILAIWQGREHEKMPPGRRMLNMSTENFLRDGFPPETIVLIRGTAKEEKHGAGLG